MKVMCGKYFLLIFDRNALMKCQYEQQDLGNRRDWASEIYFFLSYKESYVHNNFIVLTKGENHP